MLTLHMSEYCTGGGPWLGKCNLFAASLHTRHASRDLLLLIAYIYIYIYIKRELWRYFYQTVRRLSSLSLSTTKPYDDDDDDDDGCYYYYCCCCCCYYYYFPYITLSHPLRLKPLLLKTHATRSSSLPQPTETTFTYTQIYFSFLLTVGNNTLFSNLPPSFKPTASFHTHRHLLLLFKPTAIFQNIPPSLF